jgi:hypothetical protein
MRLMRDDIHKKVPRPPAVQRWVRSTHNDADRQTGRAFDAFVECQRDTGRRDFSPTFVRNLVDQCARPNNLLGPLSDVLTPRDLGGRGGPAEMETLSEAKRLLASGMASQDVPRAAIQSVLENRAQADIRATEAVLPPRDRKTPVMLASMNADASRADYRAIAESVCNGEVHERRGKVSKLDIDADLRVPTKGNR